MTTRWPCIAVATLCCLLALATSASAEGAWVLWSQSLSINLDDLNKSDLRPLSWNPIDGASTEAGCRRAMAQTIEKARQLYGGQYGDAAKFFSGDDFYAATIPFLRTRSLQQLLCLPDTVDPRGPKGK